MKVVLLAKVKGLGDKHDIKDVSDGYAVNFLFPNNLAVLSSSKMANDIKIKKRRFDKNKEFNLKELKLLIGRLDGISVTIKQKANNQGLLYASVSSQKLAEVLQGMGFNIKKDQIATTSIKELGKYSVKIRLDHNLEASIFVSVINLKI